MHETMEKRVTRLKTGKFYTRKIESAYMKVITDGNLRGIIGKISRDFHLELPTTFRRTIAFQQASSICQAVTNGVLSSSMACHKMLLLTGMDQQMRDAVFHVSFGNPSLHHALAKAWEITPEVVVPVGEVLTEKVPCHEMKDFFHCDFLPKQLQHVKTVNDDQIEEVFDEVAQATTIYMSMRYLNEPSRFIEDAGMVSFWLDEKLKAYHVFPHAGLAVSKEGLRQLMGVLARKKLRAYGRERHEQMFTMFGTKAKDIVDVKSHPAVRGAKQKMRRVFAVVMGQEGGCIATYHDIFREVIDGTPWALLHMAANLYAASLMYK